MSFKNCRPKRFNWHTKFEAQMCSFIFTAKRNKCIRTFIWKCTSIQEFRVCSLRILIITQIFSVNSYIWKSWVGPEIWTSRRKVAGKYSDSWIVALNWTTKSLSFSLSIHCRDIHINRVLQTIQMKLILLCVWAELAVLGSTKTALKFKYEI